MNLLEIGSASSKARILDTTPLEIAGLNGKVLTLGTTVLKINGSWALFHVIRMPHLPKGIAGLVGSPYLLQEEAIVSYHQRTMVTAKHPISPVIFSNFEELEGTLNGYKQCRQDFLTRLSESEPNANEINICLPENGDCSEEDEQECPSPFFGEEFDTNKDLDLGEYRVEQKSHEKRLQHIFETLKLEDLDPESRRTIENLVIRYSDRFFVPGDPLGGTTSIEHTIPVTDSSPTFIRQYPHPPLMDEEIG